MSLNQRTTIQGEIIDIFNATIFPGSVSYQDGKITSIEVLPADAIIPQQYILPGFIDAHVHIESSMLVPSEFARLAVVHGTVATVSDPHEIANVCGMDGINFMLENSQQVPFHFYFGAPSCVPATEFETAGATLNAEQVAALLSRKEILYLSEMMNYPGVIQESEDCMLKLEAAKRADKPVDGHAPGLRGNDLRKYVESGITTDHESTSLEEAQEKLSYGMKIIIREGSAARNFDQLIPLLQQHPNAIMFGSDDKHPDSLVEGHINDLVVRALAAGIPLFHVLKAACINPILHYNLNTGMLRTGDSADFIVVNNLKEWNILGTYIKGKKVAEKGVSLINSVAAPLVNKFNCSTKTEADFYYPHDKWGEQENIEQVNIIEAIDGELITRKMIGPIHWVMNNENQITSNTDKDILKIVVINRYFDAPIAKSFVKNFGLKEGAIASSVAHDSHNIIAVGVDDDAICKAVNLIIEQRGGISAVSATMEEVLPLPIAGLMSNADGYRVAAAYSQLDVLAHNMGSTLKSPFMTLSFMALLVIPHLKLSDKGLFNGDIFKLI